MMTEFECAMTEAEYYDEQYQMDLAVMVRCTPELYKEWAYICPVTGCPVTGFASKGQAVTGSQIADELYYGGHGYGAVSPDDVFWE